MTPRRILSAWLVALLLLTGCGGGDDGEEAASVDGSSTTSTSDSGPADVPAEPLTVLVTNDDGIGAPGIDALVEGLRTLDGIEIVVVAPAENQSGSGDATTEGELTVADAKTAGGFEGTAVGGKPADAVLYALETLGVEPDVVISGVNEGQNIRELSTISGTVGAAKTAARKGIPALAVSAGIIDGEAEYADAVELALAYVEENRDDFGVVDAGIAPVDSLNVPTCPTGEVRGLVEVPVGAQDERDVFTVDCESTQETFVDDVDAFVNGYAALSPIAA